VRIGSIATVGKPGPVERRGYPFHYVGTWSESTTASAQSGDRLNRLTMSSLGSILTPCVVMAQCGAEEMFWLAHSGEEREGVLMPVFLVSRRLTNFQNLPSTPQVFLSVPVLLCPADLGRTTLPQPASASLLTIG